MEARSRPLVESLSVSYCSYDMEEALQSAHWLSCLVERLPERCFLLFACGYFCVALVAEIVFL